jgi:hypothetical protein
VQSSVEVGMLANLVGNEVPAAVSHPQKGTSL